MRILITGGSGLLGQYLNLFLSEKNDILTLYNTNPGNCPDYKTIQINLLDFDELAKVVLGFKPDTVLHTACYSRPEICLRVPKKNVIRVNIEATGMIAKLCENIGAKLIFTSTDLVYDGNQSQMRKEDSLLNPVTLYAESKLLAEKEITNSTDNYIILRTSLLIGFGLNHSRNNFHLMYDNLSKGFNVKLFTDQYRTPLSLLTASSLIERFCESKIKGEIINFGGGERISRYHLGEMLCSISGFDKSLLIPISCDDIKVPSQVPDVSMNIDKMKSYGFEVETLKKQIRDILNFKL